MILHPIPWPKLSLLAVLAGSCGFKAVFFSTPSTQGSAQAPNSALLLSSLLPSTLGTAINVELLSPSPSDRILGLNRTKPLLCPSTDFVLSVGVSRLDRSFELLVVPFDLHEIDVRERTPLFLELTFELVPSTFELIDVHGSPPFD